MAASQFNYAVMTDAQTEIKTMGDNIAASVLKIAENAKAAVNACYTGEAADAYNTAFNNVAESVNAAIKEIATKLDAELAQQQADYTAKEQQMMSTVAMPTLGN